MLIHDQGVHYHNIHKWKVVQIYVLCGDYLSYTLQVAIDIQLKLTICSLMLDRKITWQKEDESNDTALNI